MEDFIKIVKNGRIRLVKRICPYFCAKNKAVAGRY